MWALQDMRPPPVQIVKRTDTFLDMSHQNSSFPPLSGTHRYMMQFWSGELYLSVLSVRFVIILQANL